MQQPILLGAVIAGVVLTVFARTFGIHGLIGRGATLAVVILLVMRARQVWRRRHPAPPKLTGIGPA
jgi:hypothetical protein